MAMANRFIPGLPPMGAPNAGAEMVVENNATEETSRMALANLILGTVSQSGGVPTGAIIERGSNSNGEFVRFADGTQICVRSNISGSSSIASGANDSGLWTYPAAFSSVIYVNANPRSLGSESDTIAAASRLSTAAGLGGGIAFWAAHNYSAVSISNVRIDVIAFGRWF